MAAHGIPFRKFFQFGRESSWGSAATVDHRVPILGITRGVKRDVIRSNAKDATRFKQVAYKGRKAVRPVVEVELTYTGLLLLIDGLMGTGTYGSNGGSTTGPSGGYYTHTLKMNELFNSFTMEFGMGNIPSGKVERFTGAKIQRATFSGRAHERCTARLEFIAKEHETNVSPTGSLASPTPDCVLFDSLSSFNDGTGTTGDLLSFELTIENMLSDRNYAAELIDEPLAGALAEATLRIVEEFQSRSAIDAHVALTQGAPALTFTSGSKSFAISMPKAYLEEGCEPDDEGDTRMIQPLVWVPIGDDASPESYLTLTVVNTQALITS